MEQKQESENEDPLDEAADQLAGILLAHLQYEQESASRHYRDAPRHLPTSDEARYGRGD